MEDLVISCLVILVCGSRVFFFFNIIEIMTWCEIPFIARSSPILILSTVSCLLFPNYYTKN